LGVNDFVMSMFDDWNVAVPVCAAVKVAPPVSELV
jgi:hypothetical protein